MKVKVGTQNLRILTAKESINPFSERFWIKRMKRIAANIKSVDLDLIAVQESIGRLQMYVLRYYLDTVCGVTSFGAYGSVDGIFTNCVGVKLS